MPSFLKRKGAGGTSRAKKCKPITGWDRDIVCIPKRKEDKNIPYPRGRFRAKLAKNGLIGKVHLSSDMSVDDVAQEICSVFQKALGEDTKFQYLQATGGTNRSLSVPSVSSSFQWTAQQVAKLGNQRNTIYIMTENDVELLDSDEEVCRLI